LSGKRGQIYLLQDLGSGELVDQFSIAAVPSGNGEFIVELGDAEVESSISFPAGLVGKGAG
jgi:hypothetical protein